MVSNWKQKIYCSSGKRWSTYLYWCGWLQLTVNRRRPQIIRRWSRRWRWRWRAAHRHRQTSWSFHWTQILQIIFVVVVFWFELAIDRWCIWLLQRQCMDDIWIGICKYNSICLEAISSMYIIGIQAYLVVKIIAEYIALNQCRCSICIKVLGWRCSGIGINGLLC